MEKGKLTALYKSSKSSDQSRNRISSDLTMDTVSELANSLRQTYEAVNRVQNLRQSSQEQNVTPPYVWAEWDEINNYVLGVSDRLLDASPNRRSNRIADQKNIKVIAQIDKIMDYYLREEKDIQARRVAQIEELHPADQER